MAEKEDKNRILSQPSVDADDVATTAAEKTLGITLPTEKKRAFVTAGEKIHKWSTYLGIDWVFNTAVGVGFAYWGNFAESGKRFWSGPITNTFTKVLSPFIKDEASLARSAGKGNMFMSIIAGGMFTIPPLMLLEKNSVRKSIIKFYDKMIYGKDKVENDPKFQQAYKEVEEAPKKDFWTGMWSRFAGLAPLLAIVLIPSTRKVSDKYYFNHIEHASGKTANAMGFSEASFKKVPLEEGKKRWKFIHESIAMDFGCGLPYAYLHAFFYNMFANIKDRKKHKTTETITPAPSLTSADTAGGTNSESAISATENIASVESQPARSFVGKVSKDVDVIGRQAITSHDSHTDFAKKNTDQELQAAL